MAETKKSKKKKNPKKKNEKTNAQKIKKKKKIQTNRKNQLWNLKTKRWAKNHLYAYFK